MKDHSQKIKPKIKPVFCKCPVKVLKEYRCTIYSIDILGRVQKHSKDNVKRAGHRSIELFGALPDELKLVLGEPMDGEIWSKLAEDKQLPEYLQHIESNLEMDRVTRGAPPKDSPALVQENTIVLEEGNGWDDDDDLLELLNEEEATAVLREMHSNIELTDASRLSDISRKFSASSQEESSIHTQANTPETQIEEASGPALKQVSEEQRTISPIQTNQRRSWYPIRRPDGQPSRVAREVDPANIVAGSRRRRVRFAI